MTTTEHSKPVESVERAKFDRDPLETAIDNFVGEYQLNDGEAFHVPSEFERLLIKDAIMGLLADEAFDSYWGSNIEKIAQEKAAALLEAQRPALKPMTDEQKQAMRLYKAVERLALQAGEDTDESVDWLCGEHGGMFKLYEAYFSPKKPDGTCPTCESLSRAVMADHVFHDKLTKPLTDERLEEMWEADTTSSEDCKSLYFFKLVARAIEAAHGIKEQA